MLHHRLAPVACLVSAACAPTVAAPPDVPSFQIDEAASEVSVRSRSGEQVKQEAAGQARAQAREILEEMLAARPDLSGARPARFRAQFVDSVSAWPLAPCLAVLTLFGCPAVVQSTEVSLTLEVSGRRFQGVGKGAFVGALYYNATGYQTRKEALTRALQDAARRARAASNEGGRR